MKVFLDSGAFSADSQGKPIDVMDYIAFIKEHYEKLEVWANLDVIGDDKATWENQRIMEEHGFGGMPVFHIEDDIKYLHKCLDYDYFALGGIAGAGSSEKRRLNFLDMCFDIICDDNGYPRSQVHGFGLASPVLLHRYPWYSFDSSSWVSYGRYGIVIMPPFVRGKFAYNTAPVKIFTSTRSPRNAEDGKHYTTLSGVEQEAFLAYLEAKDVPLGESFFFDVDENYKLTDNESFANKEKSKVERKLELGVVNDNFLRDFINYCFYVDLAISVGPYDQRRFMRNPIATLF